MLVELKDEWGEPLWVNPLGVLVVCSGRRGKESEQCGLLLDSSDEAQLVRGLSADRVADRSNGLLQSASPMFIEFSDDDGSREWINVRQVRQVRPYGAGAEIILPCFQPVTRIFRPFSIKPLVVRVVESSEAVRERVNQAKD